MKNGAPTIAGMQYDLIKNNPYRYTSDDVLFRVYAQRNNLSENEMAKEREIFFSKGQACLRSSPLVKRYGWGVHSDVRGMVAIYAIESTAYEKLSGDWELKQLRGMRSKKK